MKFSRESREIERRACHELRNDNYSERQMVNRSSTKKYQTEKIKEKNGVLKQAEDLFRKILQVSVKGFYFCLALFQGYFEYSMNTTTEGKK